MNDYKIFKYDDITRYIKDNNIQTPCYIYDEQLLKNTFALANNALSKHFKKAMIHYAIKANHNSKIVEIAKNSGMGIDCVSGGEINRALECGVTPDHIVFAGVGKADWEIELALDANIFAFNCESIQEIEIINEFAKQKNKIANICLRINPNIDAQTHHYISTGQFDDKFGISFNDVVNFLTSESLKFDNIKVIGLHYHVGSQILNYDVFKKLANTANIHIKKLDELGISIEHLNFGGGVGIDYLNPEEHPIVDFDNYFKTIASDFKFADGLMIHFELGRSLVAQSGILLSKVLFTKKTQDTNFAIIDAGMTELLRPALYQAKHKISVLAKEDDITTYKRLLI